MIPYVPLPHTQSAAIVTPGLPIPPIRLSRESIWNTQTNTPIFSIDVSSAPGSLSSKSLTTFVRTATGQVAGTLRYHSMTDSTTLTLDGAETKLTSPDYGSTLKFKPISFPGTKWKWKSEKPGFALRDGNTTLARIMGDILTVELLGLAEPAIDEIVMSALLFWRSKQKSGGGASAAFEIIGAVAQLGGGGA